jgi:hypothetical protein
MVTERLPFTGRTISDLISEILMGEPKPITELVPNANPELERVISKALRKDRAQRYQTVHELGLDLKALKQRMEFEAELKRSGERTVGAQPMNRRSIGESDVTKAMQQRWRAQKSLLGRRLAPNI